MLLLFTRPRLVIGTAVTSAAKQFTQPYRGRGTVAAHIRPRIRNTHIFAPVFLEFSGLLHLYAATFILLRTTVAQFDKESMLCLCCFFTLFGVCTSRAYFMTKPENVWKLPNVLWQTELFGFCTDTHTHKCHAPVHTDCLTD